MNNNTFPLKAITFLYRYHAIFINILMGHVKLFKIFTYIKIPVVIQISCTNTFLLKIFGPLLKDH